MKILFAKVFGIGNCVMAISAIKALRMLYPEATIDVLVGTTPDDPGAKEIMQMLEPNIIDRVWLNQARQGGEYDLAILSIPFDGRWQNGREFVAKKVMDGRTRPEPNTTGLISWKRHEVEYQMDNVRELGYQGEIPNINFFKEECLWSREKFFNTIYLGVGYKKDQKNFWSIKHWGNENFANLIKLVVEKDPNYSFVTTGDTLDLKCSILPIQQMLGSLREKLQYIPTSNIKHAFSVVNSCFLYFGNDTGFAHVAGSCGRSSVVIYNMEHSVTKNHVWSHEFLRHELEGWKEPVTVEQAREVILNAPVYWPGVYMGPDVNER